jgi:hypothetical protein
MHSPEYIKFCMQYAYKHALIYVIQRDLVL